jgi:hypothetical protein
MKVYVLTGFNAYENTYVLGVFSEMGLAESYRDNFKQDYSKASYEEYFIEEFEIDKT